MALNPGTRLGPYEITALLGVGGMGEVYRATDTNLKRQVAFKVLPASVARDPDRLARFQREAEILAVLNHPNIAHIHGLEKSDATVALVMELVEGPTLADRLAHGPIPLGEALAIAKQITEALEAAHEQGIIHRDLKPANVKVRDDGIVKVLDFGLAKAIEPAGVPSANASMSPTITTPAMTQAGIILGTAAYMSPEQAKARPADKRSDVWAFGCVLYELLTAKRAFNGEDVSDTLALILQGSPDWDALPPSTPDRIVKLIRGCLQRDRKERVPDIAVARFEIKETLADPAEPVRASVAAPLAVVPRPLWRRAAPILGAAIAAALIVGAAAWVFKPLPTTPHPVTRFSINLGDGQQFTPAALSFPTEALSPDGSRLVYVANSQLYLRTLSEPDARPIPGTAQTSSPINPVFSPDGQSIAFFSSADGMIKKIALSGGAAVTICSATSPLFGMSWAPGMILFGQQNGVMRVSDTSGQPETLIQARIAATVYAPSMLPGNEWLLFTTRGSASDSWDAASIVVQSLKTGARKTLVTGGSDAHYVSTGHIVYALGGVLFAVPFDIRRMSVTGGPVPVIEGVRRPPAPISGTAHFTISSTGTVAYLPGPISTGPNQTDLVTIDRNGAIESLKLPPGRYEYPRVSPDGTRVAFDSDDGRQAVIYIYDLSGASSMRPLTVSGRNRMPVWADNDRIVFQSDREGDAALWWQRADGSAPAERLTKPDRDTAHLPESMSPDKSTLLLSVSSESGVSLGAWSMAEKKLFVPFADVTTTFPVSAVFSPDGKWFAYTRSLALFVQPFPPTRPPFRVAVGLHPIWPADTELFWGTAPGQVSGATVTTKPTFAFSTPSPLSKPLLDRGPAFERDYDAMPGGQRFLTVMGVRPPNGARDETATRRIDVVLNWFTELQQRVPTK